MAGSWTAVLRAAQGTPEARVVLIPHAGAGPNVLMPLAERLPPRFEVLGVTLPGRERRFSESFKETPSDPHAVVEGVLGELVALPSLPTVLFGHSMGAAVAAAIALAKPEPFTGLVLSAYPSGGSAAERAGRWSDDDLVKIMRAGGGTPDEILASPFWREHVMALLRSDLTLGLRLAQVSFLGPVAVPLTVLGAHDDQLVPSAELPAWRDRAGAGLRTRMFDGGHFYLLDEPHVGEVAAELARACLGNREDAQVEGDNGPWSHD
ncbi:alpha/beta fold hydrolase [Saccharothrix sp. AJ9571]|nr:alpha/beta fold hydrolase [Saccharothrix sp. AJ9571]